MDGILHKAEIGVEYCAFAGESFGFRLWVLVRYKLLVNRQ